mmetsp:Transcript_10835/g.17651  ORF Transcript_10835/g.17651 Transcript_10835/m.17651 type:complete len:272 (+) Transcript_10835:51-866(+)|eukprot:CAMPEP_0174983346 /NCGR_PEP_ID=MMETSP0004_2-20121128/17076_1 /TAXON_ID=420556 /ORGANISM="Ochromonas sp., Strain CCMP1393" /LENGTH=271 /DNA_ID=CAMNT_0016235555 /DNA_START=36 /DNA_END=851 /DNA_ORIENTATION=+
MDSSPKSVLVLHADSVTADVESAGNIVVKASECPSALENLQNDSFDEIKVKNIVPDDDILEKLMELCKDSAKMVVEGVPDRETGQALAIDLKILGFINIMAAKDPASGDRFVVCQKSALEVGSSAPVKLQTSTPKVAVTVDVSAVAEGKKWKMDVDDLADDDLIDENDLLDADFKAPDPTANSGGGCGAPGPGGKRRACKDCSCGLADASAADVAAKNASATIEEKVVRSSACGSCYKGDAFRCASCPFLGKPAFEPGNEKVVLTMGNDDI